MVSTLAPVLFVSLLAVFVWRAGRTFDTLRWAFPSRLARRIGALAAIPAAGVCGGLVGAGMEPPGAVAFAATVFIGVVALVVAGMGVDPSQPPFRVGAALPRRRRYRRGSGVAGRTRAGDRDRTWQHDRFALARLRHRRTPAVERAYLLGVGVMLVVGVFAVLAFG
ncbi:MAG: hypothetical protein V4850_35195 [Myxococcota bacterium]